MAATEDRAKLVLRDYQQACVDVCDALESGSHLVQMATGLGKTVTFANLHRCGRLLLLAHRKEILLQAQSYFDVPVGIEMAELHSHGEQVVAASVSSLVHRLDKFRPDDFDIIVTDEAHHAVAPSYGKVYGYFSPRLHLGFTATPNRGDKVRLNDVFDDIVFSRDLKWGIDQGYLSDIDCRQVVVDYNPRAMKTQRSRSTNEVDFQLKELDAAMNTPRTNEQIAEAYRKYATGQTLVFAASVSHAHALAKLIDGAQVVEAKTPADERDRVLNGFRTREFPCLINNLVFTEGTDIPVIDTVLLARPTKNSTLYQQMVGRGLRLYPGKAAVRLIDCVGSTYDCKLCCAPSLLGLDPEKLNARYRQRAVEGLVSQMESRFASYDDTPLSWIMRANRVNLFEGESGYRFRNVNWVCLGNGSYMVATKRVELHIPPEDLMGESVLETVDRQTKLVLSTSERMPMQQLFDRARDMLVRKAGDQRQLWDVQFASRWGNQPATAKQREFIETLCTEDELADLRDEVGARLTKGEAGYLITNGRERRAREKAGQGSRAARPSQVARIHALHKQQRIPAYVYRAIPFSTLDEYTAWRILSTAESDGWD